MERIFERHVETMADKIRSSAVCSEIELMVFEHNRISQYVGSNYFLDCCQGYTLSEDELTALIYVEGIKSSGYIRFKAIKNDVAWDIIKLELLDNNGNYVLTIS